jgi:hypothetical protein
VRPQTNGSMFHLNTTVTTHIALHAYDATNGNIKVLQPYPSVTVFALLQIVKPFQLFCNLINTSYRKHLLCPKSLLPVGVLLSYLAPPCQHTHFKMLHKQQQTMLMQRDSPERTHVLLVNTCSYLYSFCTTGIAAIRVTSVPQRGWGSLLYIIACDFCWLHIK